MRTFKFWLGAVLGFAVGVIALRRMPSLLNRPGARAQTSHGTSSIPPVKIPNYRQLRSAESPVSPTDDSSADRTLHPELHGILFASSSGKNVGFTEPVEFRWAMPPPWAGLYVILVPDGMWSPRNFRPIY